MFSDFFKKRKCSSNRGLTELLGCPRNSVLTSVEGCEVYSWKKGSDGFPRLLLWPMWIWRLPLHICNIRAHSFILQRCFLCVCVWDLLYQVLLVPLEIWVKKQRSLVNVGQAININTIQFSSVAQSCRLFATPWIAARQASLSITNSWGSLRLTSVESVMPSSHLILGRPLLLLPPIPPSIRVFSNESTLHLRWPKYWSFSFKASAQQRKP